MANSGRMMGPRGDLALFRRPSPVRVTGAAFAVFALLIQVWLPWIHHPGISALADEPTHARAGIAFVGGDFPICLAQRSSAPDRSGDPTHTPSQKLPPCPICQALHMLGSFVPPTNAVLVEGPPSGDPGVITFWAPLIARTLASTSQPRAPPVTT